MSEAGFVDVTSEAVQSQLRAPSAQEFASAIRDAGGGPSPMLAGADEATKEAVWVDIALSLREFETDGDCVFPGELLVAAGRRV